MISSDRGICGSRYIRIKISTDHDIFGPWYLRIMVCADHGNYGSLYSMIMLVPAHFTGGLIPTFGSERTSDVNRGSRPRGAGTPTRGGKKRIRNMSGTPRLTRLFNSFCPIKTTLYGASVYKTNVQQAMCTKDRNAQNKSARSSRALTCYPKEVNWYGKEVFKRFPETFPGN
ncbi:hypothetical protein DPMN_089881 [Dreissena polymorpha]|uniref:Uncharacterized protein n=1 Tax=Dreissena polymorpha TaxID=45954 RepID=A0A9D4KZ43_DREPO|nr:hypothetical protein DPMN_089881 [Dreissena polymorpha]